MNSVNGHTNGTKSNSVHSKWTPDVVPLIIGGKEVVGTNTFEVRGSKAGHLWYAGGATVKDATHAVAAAQAALPGWARTKPAVRRDIFLRAAEIFQRRLPELAELQETETGAQGGFIHWILNLTVDNLKEVAGKCCSIRGDVFASSEEGKGALVLKEPYGVILGIAPWNAPWPLGCRAVSYALAAGNTCVLKGPELSPRCYYEIVSTFKEAGLPDGCLNLIFHRAQDAAEITNTLIAHPAVRKVNFTGSTAVGAIVSATAGKYLKPIITELGGKASTIVLQDADVPKAAMAAAMGAFMHAGQVCMATERVIVHRSIVDDFIAAFKKATDTAYGPDSEYPNFVTPTGAQKTKSLVKTALESGAQIIYGQAEESTQVDTQSAKMRPIILTDVAKGSKLYETESFGPSVAIYTFETEEEALAIANDTEYGLAGSVFTRDLAAGLRIARGYETGAVHINGMTIHDESNLPHGGAKNSGFGRFTGHEGMQEWLRCKVVTYDE